MTQSNPISSVSDKIDGEIFSLSTEAKLRIWDLIEKYADDHFIEQAPKVGFWGRACSRKLTEINELKSTISDLNAHISRLGAENEKLMEINAQLRKDSL